MLRSGEETSVSAQSKFGGRQWGERPEREAGRKNADHLSLIGLGNDLGCFPPVTWKARGVTMI